MDTQRSAHPTVYSCRTTPTSAIVTHECFFLHRTLPLARWPHVRLRLQHVFGWPFLPRHSFGTFAGHVPPGLPEPSQVALPGGVLDPSGRDSPPVLP